MLPDHRGNRIPIERDVLRHGVAVSPAEVVAKTLAISGDATPRFMPSAEDNRSGEILSGSRG